MNNIVNAHILKRYAADVRNNVTQLFFRIVFTKDSVSLLHVSDAGNDLYPSAIVPVELDDTLDKRLSDKACCSGYKKRLSVKDTQIHYHHS